MGQACTTLYVQGWQTARSSGGRWAVRATVNGFWGFPTLRIGAKPDSGYCVWLLTVSLTFAPQSLLIK